MTVPSTALITGATAGIGAEFARQLAARGCNLVIIARDAERLEATAQALRAATGVSVEVLAADLLAPEGLAAVEARVAASDIDILVNNAGFGLIGTFDTNAIADEQRHLDLLVTVPMRLMHVALQHMVAARRGTIINIASVAGFTPRGSYGAAKAWVLSMSRWANIHYRPLGVTVTAVAPGFVHTEFHERMHADKSTVPAFMWLTADRLVRAALRDVDAGRGISVPSARYKVIVWLSKWMPARVIAKGALRGR